DFLALTVEARARAEAAAAGPGGEIEARAEVLRRSRSGRCRGKQIEDPLVDGRARAARVDRLNADVIRARIPEKLEALADGAFVSPGDVGIDESVGPAAGKVVVRESEATPVVGIVLELNVEREGRASGRSRLGWIGLEQHHDLRTKELARAQDAARLRRVFGRHAIGV